MIVTKHFNVSLLSSYLALSDSRRAPIEPKAAARNDTIRIFLRPNLEKSKRGEK